MREALRLRLIGHLSSYSSLDPPSLPLSPPQNLILMMEPTTIIGAVAGSFLNKILPELVISILLVIILALLAHRTLQKVRGREGGREG
jgi:Na+/H+-dicarboxylate symporter